MRRNLIRHIGAAILSGLLVTLPCLAASLNPAGAQPARSCAPDLAWLAAGQDRAAAERAFRQRCWTDTVTWDEEAILRNVTHEQAIVRRFALDQAATQRLASEAIIEAAIARLADTEEDVRLQALDTLMRVGQPAAPHLEKFLFEPGTQTGIEFPLSTDLESFLPVLAASAFGNLKGRDLSSAVEAYRRAQREPSRPAPEDESGFWAAEFKNPAELDARLHGLILKNEYYWEDLFRKLAYPRPGDGETLTAMLRSGDPILQDTALRLAPYVRAPAAPFVEALAEVFLAADDDMTRFRAARALTASGSRGDEMLRQKARGADRLWYLATTHELHGPARDELMNLFRSHPDPAVRGRAMNRLLASAPWRDYADSTRFPDEAPDPGIVQQALKDVDSGIHAQAYALSLRLLAGDTPLPEGMGRDIFAAFIRLQHANDAVLIRTTFAGDGVSIDRRIDLSGMERKIAGLIGRAHLRAAGTHHLLALAAAGNYSDARIVAGALFTRMLKAEDESDGADGADSRGMGPGKEQFANAFVTLANGNGLSVTPYADTLLRSRTRNDSWFTAVYAVGRSSRQDETVDRLLLTALRDSRSRRSLTALDLLQKRGYPVAEELSDFIIRSLKDRRLKAWWEAAHLSSYALRLEIPGTNDLLGSIVRDSRRDPEVRGAVLVRWSDESGQLHAPLRSAILAAARDKNPMMRAMAASALGQWQLGDDMAAALLELARDRDQRVRKTLFDALWPVKPAAGGGSEPLPLSRLPDFDPVFYELRLPLSPAGNRGRPARDLEYYRQLLRLGVKDRVTEIRSSVLRSLVRYARAGGDPGAFLPELVRNADEPGLLLVLSMVEQLEPWGGQILPEAVRRARQLANDKEFSTTTFFSRLGSVASSLHSRAQPAVRPLLDWLMVAEVPDRVAILRVLSQFERLPTKDLEAVRPLLLAPGDLIRHEAARLIVAKGPLGDIDGAAAYTLVDAHKLDEARRTHQRFLEVVLELFDGGPLPDAPPPLPPMPYTDEPLLRAGLAAAPPRPSSSLPSLPPLPKPPQAAWQLPVNLLGGPQATLDGVKKRLERTLQAVPNSSYDYGLFSVPPDGFAMLVRLEGIRENGAPVDNAALRWPRPSVSDEPGHISTINPADLVAELAYAPPGYYRAFVFVVSRGDQPPYASEGQKAYLPQIEEGARELPAAMADRPIGDDLKCWVLAYAYEKVSGTKRPKLGYTGNPETERHFVNSGLRAAMESL